MPEFEAYIQRYAKGYDISEAEARQEAIVQSVKHHYENPDKNEFIWW